MSEHLKQRMQQLELLVEKTENYPVAVFFNTVVDSNFIDTVEHLVNSVGIGINAVSCDFPMPEDPWEEPFEGVKFRISLDEDEEVIVSQDDFLIYLKIACEAYIIRHPNDLNKLQKLFTDKGIDLFFRD